MKLPKITKEMEDALGLCEPGELVMLHCLRSIAVNLEVLAIIHLNQHEKNTDTVKAAKILAAHSVAGSGRDGID